jgi:[acyl-carrier-protein] S-malonyltransferase
VYKNIAFVFPGQGSQVLGMLSDLAIKFPFIKDIYHNASTILGYNLWEITQNGPEEILNQTEYTQPALLAAEFAMWQIWRKLSENSSLTPAYLAGHSLGEYSALVCANALAFADAIALVAMRGKLMQAAVPRGTGGMAAIVGLDEEQIQKVCKEAAQGEVLEPANYNSIGQTVLSGNLAAVERAVMVAKALGAKVAKLLNVSVPSHCKLMQSAANKLAEYLAQTSIQEPMIPVVNNVEVKTYTTTTSIRSGLMQQLYNPVRWVEIIQFFKQKQLDCLVECGPGKVLAGLNKRVVAGLPTLSFEQFIGESYGV